MLREAEVRGIRKGTAYYKICIRFGRIRVQPVLMNCYGGGGGGWGGGGGGGGGGVGGVLLGGVRKLEVWRGKGN
jgi:hypothetical protein